MLFGEFSPIGDPAFGHGLWISRSCFGFRNREILQIYVQIGGLVVCLWQHRYINLSPALYYYHYLDFITTWQL